jgi:putative DNA primase/helicase
MTTSTTSTNGRHMEAAYDYQDEAGVMRFQTVRFEPKDFRQRRPDGRNGWVWNLAGVPLLLYRLPELLAAPTDQPVFLAEGEKDVEALRAKGLTATTCPLGAGKWKPCFNEALRDRHVVILPDNDDPGRQHASNVARALAGIAASVKVLHLPGLPPKGDVSDWLQRGGTGTELLEMAAATRAKARHEGNGTEEPGPEGDESVATAADLIRLNAFIRWAWKGWIPIGVLTVLAAEPGCGKTRFCADLARRIYLGLPWPDGTGPTLPHGSTTLWVAADNQHPELGTLPGEFGFPPECLYLNAPASNPFAGTLLDERLELDAFERRIEIVKPALVIVDTTLNATERSAHKPEDAKAFFTPLQQIAARRQIPLIGVTHLNAAGKPLGRRIMGQARVVMQMEFPDQEQKERRKLHVVKSNSKYPSPLGVTMGDHGNEYDLDPPKATDAEPGKTSNKTEIQKAVDWLWKWLEEGPKAVGSAREAAEEKGISSRDLYRAKEKMPVEEYRSEGRKFWRLVDDPFDADVKR